MNQARQETCLFTPPRLLKSSITLCSYVLLMLTLALPFWPSAANANSSLPSLGDSSSGLIGYHQERQLGQAWLRSLRKKAPIINDPLLEDYYESLVYRLAPNADLSHRDFLLVIIDSPTINAFAVPGGIIGIHSGLLINALNEQQFAAVIAHELAHLSQRHYARSLEKSQNDTPLRLAGLLASIVIAATAGGEAGMAALATTQAASIQSQLNYSRQNEQEADRIGIQTLYYSNFDPQAMPEMFEQMQRESRLYGNRPPEYLSTHPITESRIADSKNRADQYPNKTITENFEYALMRSRAIALSFDNSQQAVNHFRGQIHQGNTPNEIATRYGLVVALLNNREGESALSEVEQLLQSLPDRITFIAAKAEALSLESRTQEAIDLLEKHLKFSPGNYPLTWQLAVESNKSKDFKTAARILEQLTRDKPNNPKIWYSLSENYGQLGDVVNVHRSLAEFYALNGDYKTALLQLKQALKLTSSSHTIALIQARMDAFFEAQKEFQF